MQDYYRDRQNQDRRYRKRPERSKKQPFSVRVQTLDGSIEWMPSRENSTDASFTVKAKSFTDEELESYVLEPDARVLINSGFILDLMPGWEAQIRTKHNLAIDVGLAVLDSPSTIDSSHKDEIKIILVNNGEDDITLESGSEVAQMVVTKMPHVKLWHVEKIQSSVKDIESEQ